MSQTKKLLSLLLAIMMVFCLSASAMAAVNITITRDDSYVTDSVDGASPATGDREYTYYQVFHAVMGTDHTTQGGGVADDGTPSDVTTTPTNGVSYYLDATSEKEKALIEKFKGEGNKWFALSASADGSQYVVSWKDGMTANAENAAAAAAWIVKAEAYIKTGKLTWNKSSETWTAEVDEGYYVIGGSEGKNLVAATTNITIAEKNSYPKIDKKEQDEDKTSFVDTSVNVAVGDTIDYKVDVTIPGDANQIIDVIDKMTTGLTYDAATGNLKVKQGETEIPANEYSFVTDTTNGWHIQLPATTVAKYKNSKITITFTATVNSKALTDTGRDNTVTLKYNNTSYQMTDKVLYTTYFAGIVKVDGANSSKKLQGVEFTLTEKAKTEGATALDFKVSPVTDPNNADKVLYYIPDTINGSTTVVTNADGKIIIRGLDNDKTYTLTETKTQAGYNLLDEAHTLKNLVEDTADNYNYDATGDTFDTVVNNQGSILPTTGGMGTTLLYVGGVALVAAAAILLVFKKRMSVEK